MGKVREPWSKEVQIALIRRDWYIADLAREIGVNKSVVYNAINKGPKAYPAPILRKKISKLLEIPTPDELEMKLDNKKSL